MDHSEQNLVFATDDEQDSMTLEDYILKASDLVDVMKYRLDSMQRALEYKSFSLENLSIRLREDVSTSSAMSRFLTDLSLSEDTLTLGLFLKALNTHLVRNELVDLNDLEIYVPSYLKEAFNMEPSLEKVPYATVLWHIPQVFR
jgi:hypothetical protein